MLFETGKRVSEKVIATCFRRCLLQGTLHSLVSTCFVSNFFPVAFRVTQNTPKQTEPRIQTKTINERIKKIRKHPSGLNVGNPQILVCKFSFYICKENIKHYPTMKSGKYNAIQKLHLKDNAVAIRKRVGTGQSRPATVLVPWSITRTFKL